MAPVGACWPLGGRLASWRRSTAAAECWFVAARRLSERQRAPATSAEEPRYLGGARRQCSAPTRPCQEGGRAGRRGGQRRGLASPCRTTTAKRLLASTAAASAAEAVNDTRRDEGLLRLVSGIDYSVN